MIAVGWVKKENLKKILSKLACANEGHGKHRVSARQILINCYNFSFTEMSILSLNLSYFSKFKISENLLLRVPVVGKLFPSKFLIELFFTAFVPFIFTFKLRQGQTLLMFQHSIQHVSLSFWIRNRFVAIIFGSNSSHKHLSLFINYLASKFFKNGFHPLVT